MSRIDEDVDWGKEIDGLEGLSDQEKRKSKRALERITNILEKKLHPIIPKL